MVFSGCFSLCPFNLCPLDPGYENLWQIFGHHLLAIPSWKPPIFHLSYFFWAAILSASGLRPERGYRKNIAFGLSRKYKNPSRKIGKLFKNWVLGAFSFFFANLFQFSGGGWNQYFSYFRPEARSPCFSRRVGCPFFERFSCLCKNSGSSAERRGTYYLSHKYSGPASPRVDFATPFFTTCVDFAWILSWILLWIFGGHSVLRLKGWRAPRNPQRKRKFTPKSATKSTLSEWKFITTNAPQKGGPEIVTRTSFCLDNYLDSKARSATHNFKNYTCITHKYHGSKNQYTHNFYSWGINIAITHTHQLHSFNSRGINFCVMRVYLWCLPVLPLWHLRKAITQQ